MFQIQRQKLKQKRIKWFTIIGISLIVLLTIASGAWYLYKQRQHKEAAQLIETFTPNPQTELGNDSSTDSDATNTRSESTVLEGGGQPTASRADFPTPILAKSSGNNGSVPAGAMIEFTCTASSGYDCDLRLSGPKTINLGKKKLTDNDRGQSIQSWTWSAQPGSWSVTAVLSNSAGEKSSAAQSLEVK